MRTIRQAISLAMIFALSGATFLARAQSQRAYGITDREMEQLLRRIDTRADRFRTSLSQALDQSRLDQTAREDNINQMVADFGDAAANLRDRYNRGQSTSADVENLLDRAARVNNFMERRNLLYEAESDWRALRDDLDQLARAYNITWDWTARGSRWQQGTRRNDSLTGTFRLNTSQSDDPRLVVERVVRNLPYSDRERAQTGLMRRMDAPQMLAIERRGQTITLASSNAPQTTFEADGREQTEQIGNTGRVIRTRASLSGDRLSINTTGNRATDFTITIEPINNGRQLQVTRQLYSDRFDDVVTVNSIYDQVSNVAQWDVYTGRPDYSRGDRGAQRAANDYIVPDGTPLVARLNTDLSTERTQAGDRFTMTVLSPGRYEGAIIEGTVTEVSEGGRLTGRAGMSLALNSIRMPNGQTYAFEGTLESVRSVNGEDIRVDTEGTVENEDSQTGRTVQRTAIGTALGAVLGAIIGGGKGAAIGAAIGAGTGAGSVYVQGRDDLELNSGTELTVRASAPRADRAR